MVDLKYNLKMGFRRDYDPNNRIVRQDNIFFGKDKYFVSIVDLGIDMSMGIGKPLYYETMIFKNDDMHGIYQRRFNNRHEALNNHYYIIHNFSSYFIKEFCSNGY